MYTKLLQTSLPVVVTVPPLLYQPVVDPEVIANIPNILVVLDTLPEDEIETPPEGIVQEVLIEIEELIGDEQSAAKTFPEIIQPPERTKGGRRRLNVIKKLRQTWGLNFNGIGISK
jgi:hypothetical protein